jgi:formate dehydrogenase maturation protein FdhE
MSEFALYPIIFDLINYKNQNLKNKLTKLTKYLTFLRKITKIKNIILKNKSLYFPLNTNLSPDSKPGTL